MPSQEFYTVNISDFAERHYIKSFRKKYHKKWEVTQAAIIAGLSHLDTLLLTDRAETITHSDNLRIIKVDFKIATIPESAKSSGNRCIAVTDDGQQTVDILLVYGKTDLSGSGSETAKWQNLIKVNYPEYRDLF